MGFGEMLSLTSGRNLENFIFWISAHFLINSKADIQYRKLGDPDIVMHTCTVFYFPSKYNLSRTQYAIVDASKILSPVSVIGLPGP